MSKHKDPNAVSDWPATLRVILGLGVIWGCLFLVALAQEQSRKQYQGKTPPTSASTLSAHR